MTHRLGVYWAPGHGRPGDLEYMRQLQPRAIRILDPDVQHISDAHRTVPNALILPRDWALSEQAADVNRDPAGTGKRHAQEWRTRINQWRDQATARSIPFPRDTQIVIVGANEPNQGISINAQVAYTVALCEEARALGMTVSALNLGVGWPGNHGPGMPPDWEPYRPALEAIQRGGHFLCTHEYFYDDPANGWGWLAGRHLAVPAWFTGRMIIGECGIDRYVDAERWRNEGGNRGWRGNVGAEQYAGQLTWYAVHCDPRVVAVLPFLTDYRSREWESFDTQEAHAHIVAHAATPGHTVHIPAIVVGQPVTVTPDTTPPVGAGDCWARSLAFVKRWEGGYQNVANDSGNWTSGVVGVGENKGTNWGISAASYPDLDIKNLSREEAHAIFQRDYWIPSGAAKLAWPACLVVLDTAILHGVGTATAWQAEVGTNAFAFAAKRLRVYTDLSNWDYWGKAWILRVADLLEECAQ